MSIYQNYKISVENDNLSFNYNNINLLEINSKSNNFKLPIKSPSYLFNNNSGFLFNPSFNSITYSASSNIFTNDLIVLGKLQASSFPSNVLILDDNNKINSSYLPSIDNFIVYNTNSIAIGTSTPIANIQLNDGNAYFKNSRIGIGTFPSYYFHLNKVDTMPLQPAFVISSNSKHIMDIYTELETIVINNDGSPLDTNAKLNVMGLLKANEIKTPQFITSNKSTIINNELYINNINSFQSSIIIHSNIDLILSNNSIGSLSSNIINLNNSVDFFNKTITSNSNLLITTSNTIINNLQTSTITTSNINILNIDSLTSNPSAESVMDFKGKIRLFNDTENIIIKIFSNNDTLFLITKNNKLYSYSSNQISLISSNFFYNTFKAKYDKYAYTFNNNLYLNGNLILENTIIRDFALSPENHIFYINQIGAVISLDLSTNIQIFINDFTNLRKIESYLDNSFIVLTDNNLIYHYKNNLYSIITLSPQLIIEDMASGDDHTILQTNQGVWSFGSNDNNLTFKKGYSNVVSFSIAQQISYFNQTPKIKSIKVIKNSSIVYDINSNVYIFGNINKLFQTQQIYKINDITKVLDFCCDNNSVYLLSYFNDLFTLGNNNIPNNIILNEDFYGTSIKSKGSIIIGGDYFYKNNPRNSLLVQNFVGIGSNISYNPAYSLVVNGNINIIGSIFNNGVLFVGGGGTGSSVWKKNINDIYYNDGNVGVGLVKPLTPLHINGNATFESNVIIKGKIIANGLSPFLIKNHNNIYYRGKVDINSLEINDGILNINTIINSSNLIYNDVFQKSLVTISTNTTYINPILINENSSIIISSYFTLDNINNNSNVVIYKLINNNWVKYPIIDNLDDNNSFGKSFAISKDGSNIFIGAYKEKLQSGIQTGCIYKYSFNNLNNLIKDPIKILSINQNNTYNYIGNKICCSSDGNILISTIFNNNYKIFIKDIKYNIDKIIDFTPYNSFHTSFNNINPNQITIDTNNDGSIIIMNYIFDTNTFNISLFAYYNLYIIKDFEIYFLKFNSIHQNSLITSLSISSDNSRIFISTALGHHFIYEINFENYETINFNSTTIIKYFDLQHSFYFYKLGYKGVISKNGNFFHLSNNSNIFIYKFNSILNNWSERKILNIPQNIHNYSLSIDGNGFNISVSLITKLNDTELIDDININNFLYNIHENNLVFNYTSSNLIVNTDVFLNSNITCQNLIANGSNVYNVLTNNLVNNYNQNGMMYTSNNLIYSSSNITYNDELKKFHLNIDGIFTSNIFILSNLTTTSNISTINGNIISGKNILSTSNIISYSNIICSSNFSTTYGNITSASNISAINNITANNHIIAGNRISCFFDIITIYGNIKSGNNLIADKEVIATNKISTTLGNIVSASNIFANKDIYGCLFFGDGSNLSNINPSNIISPVQLDKGGTGRSNFNKGEILVGNGSNFINSFNDFTLDFETKTLNVSNINISSNLILNGSNFSNLNFSFQQITGINTFDKGGLGFNQISKSNLIFANEDNQLKETSNIRWDDIGSNLTIEGNLKVKKIYGDGSTISNLKVDFNTIGGIVPFQKGGLGFNQISKSNLIIAIEDNQLTESSNIRWDEVNSNFLVNGNIYAQSFYGDGSNLSNLKVDFDTIGGIIPFNKGGLGFNQISKSNLIFANEDNQFKETSNIRWDEVNSNFFIDGYIFGDGSNISNINPSNLISPIQVDKGGTGRDFYSNGEIILGSGSNYLNSFNDFYLDIETKTLNVSNINISSNLILNGANFTNLNFSFEQINGIIGIDKGGLGFNQISKSNLIFANEDNQLKETSNIRWDEVNSNFIIDGYIFGNGSNISNINPSNLISPIQVDKGGTGRDFYNNGEIIFGSGGNYLNSFNDFYLDIETKTLNVSNINISSNLILNGSNFSNLNFSFEQINGIAGFDKGGLGFNQISKSNLIFANEDNHLKESSNIRWDELNSNFFIDGYIFGDGSNITNINYSNITGIIGFDKGGLGFNQISKSNLIFANENNRLKETSNIRWDEVNSNLLIDGYLNIGFKEYDENYKMKVDGNIYVSGNVIGLSDINLKKNIEVIENPLDKINKLRGVYFNYKNNDERRQIGMIAQEVEKIIPEVVYMTNEETKAIAYNNLIGLLIEGIKELSNKINSK